MQRRCALSLLARTGANDISDTDEEEEASDEAEETSKEEDASLLTPAGIITGQEAALRPSAPHLLSPAWLHALTRMQACSLLQAPAVQGDHLTIW